MFIGYSLIERAVYYRTDFKGRLDNSLSKITNLIIQIVSLCKLVRTNSLNHLLVYLHISDCIFGEGAYRASGDEKSKNDIFAYTLGKQTYVKPSPTFDINKNQNKGVSDSPTDGKDQYGQKN